MVAVPIPCWCEHCGHVFTLPNLIGVAPGGAAVVTLEGNLTNCPHCGADATIADGTFRLAEGIVELIRGPQATREILQNLHRLAVAAYRTGTVDDRLQRAVEEVSPEMASKLEQVRNDAPALVPLWLLFLIMIIIKVLSVDVSMNVDIDVNQLIDQLRSEQVEDIVNQIPE